jgi:hypothetical protein
MITRRIIAATALVFHIKTINGLMITIKTQGSAFDKKKRMRGGDHGAPPSHVRIDQRQVPPMQPVYFLHHKA